MAVSSVISITGKELIQLLLLGYNGVSDIDSIIAYRIPMELANGL